MRTLQIGDLWLPEAQGGLSRYYYELLRHLPAAGVESKGLLVGSSKVAAETHGEVQAFARPTDLLPKRLLAMRLKGTATIKEFQPDLVATHFAIYALPLMTDFRQTPHVVHFHGPWSGESGAEGARGIGAMAKACVERLVYRSGKRLIVLSDAFRRELVEGYGVDESRIRIVPGGVDADRFNDRLTRGEARQLLGWPLHRPIVLTVRRQVRRMGLENLIEATVELARKVPEVLVLLGGTGPLATDLQRLVDERGLQQHLRLLGRIEDEMLPTAYRAADLTVVPTVALEGFGLITLESLASGTPVYVTPIGGLAEVVRPFNASCVFAGTAPADLAATLADSLTGRQQLPGSDLCRSYAVENFSWPRIAEMVRRVYGEAIY
jgi:glycosyltransferase involved in cell wall biosynthesis